MAEGGVELIGSGDIATCEGDGDLATGELIRARPRAAVFTTGDNAYRDGTAQQFQDCYEPAWGSFRDRTRPALGNHDYATPGAAGYFGYFGERVKGPDGGGWYSYRLGEWKVIVLNSNCGQVGGCGPTSRQYAWLLWELQNDPAACTLAIWHHPRFSSARERSDNRQMNPLWDALYEHGAEMVLSGHHHLYERLAPQRSDGTADFAHGVRQFTIGTGGAEFDQFGIVEPNSERRLVEHGVLSLRLNPGRYDWQFLGVGGGVPDAGGQPCHGPPNA